MYVIHFHFSQGSPLHLTKFIQFMKRRHLFITMDKLYLQNVKNYHTY
jgi:hypothetical protein